MKPQIIHPIRRACERDRSGAGNGRKLLTRLPGRRALLSVALVCTICALLFNFLVAYRLWRVGIIPLYSLSVLAAFFAARFTTVYINGQSKGLYDHYFNTFLIPSDLLWSFLRPVNAKRHA